MANQTYTLLVRVKRGRFQEARQEGYRSQSKGVSTFSEQCRCCVEEVMEEAMRGGGSSRDADGHRDRIRNNYVQLGQNK